MDLIKTATSLEVYYHSLTGEGLGFVGLGQCVPNNKIMKNKFNLNFKILVPQLI